MKNYKKIQLCVYLLTTPILAFAQNPLIATGYYFNGQTQSPLLAVSHDQGISWSYPESINQDGFPEHYHSGGVGPVSCTSQRCIVAGNWYDENGMSIPLLANSNDEGLTWTYIDLAKAEHTLPDNFRRGWLNSLSCNESSCLVGGYYTDQEGISRPLLLVGENKDPTTWKGLDSQIQSAFPEDFDQGKFHSISCTEEICIAVGMYQNDNNDQEYPLLITSKDNGNTWESPLSSDNFNYPENFLSGNFYSVTCFQKICIASGKFKSYDDIFKPFLLTSLDQGKTWESPQLPLPENLDSGYFLDTNCGKAHCIAAGTFLNKNQNEYPLLIYSQDGLHWVHPKDILGDDLPEGFQEGNFIKTTCNDKTCMAAGVYYTWEGAHPLIITSQDKGEIWHYPPSAQVSHPNALAGDGLYLQISCNATICFATGDFLDNTFYTEKNPLLSVSQDEGNTWFYPETITDRWVLPPQFMNGGFKSSN